MYYKMRKGFTLVELIVVIAILAVLSAVLVPTIANYINKANMSTAHANGATVLEAANRVTTNIQVGHADSLNSDSILAESNLTVIEGFEEINNAIVIKIAGNTVDTLWSMKGGQLAMWTSDRGWVFGVKNIEYIEDELTELSFGLANGNTAYVVKDGSSFTKSSLTIPATYKGLPVIGVANNAFNGLTTLNSIYLPSSLKYIGVSTFNGCTGLTSVTIPASVESVGNNAFNGCTNLNSVTVQRSSTNSITSGGTNMFQNTHTNLKIYVPSNSVNSYKAANGWSKYSDAIIGT